MILNNCSEISVAPLPEGLKEDEFVGNITGNGSEFSNDQGEDGIILLHDAYEMGGTAHRLIEIFEPLQKNGIISKTASLKSGDYLWIQRKYGIVDFFPSFPYRSLLFSVTVPVWKKEGN